MVNNFDIEIPKQKQLTRSREKGKEEHEDARQESIDKVLAEEIVVPGERELERDAADCDEDVVVVNQLEHSASIVRHPVVSGQTDAQVLGRDVAIGLHGEHGQPAQRQQP